MRFTTALPIDDVLAPLTRALTEHTAVVLEAPPGAGKTTRVPLALLDQSWLQHRRILMLEPRRLAARSAAQFMATTVGETVGGTIGYRVRGEARVSPRTRVEVVTEGVLTRMLSSDQSLSDYGVIVFDEFHERSLHADLGLALVLETQQHLRDDLRILIMSATLDGLAVAQLLSTPAKPAVVIRSEGIAHPVETLYRPPRNGDRVEAIVSRVVREAISANEGDVLVFLPGAGEQRRVAARLSGDTLLHDARVTMHQLHGAMPLAAQDAAIAPAPVGTRKVVLTTSVAETSLTVAGIRVVIDSGLSRLPRFDARAGLTRLETVRVSRASADQRRGRAGRVAPGTCYRVWDQHEDAALVPRTRPEMLDADLSSLALELADAGIHDPTTLRWLDVPNAGAYARARELLSQLGAIDTAGRITPHGTRMATLPLQPRLAHLLLVAQQRGLTRLGGDIAALLEERDILSGQNSAMAGSMPPSDLRLRVDALQRVNSSHDSDDTFAFTLGGARVNRDAAWRVRQLGIELTQRVTATTRTNTVKEDARETVEQTGELLALAFPDRIAHRRVGREPRYLLRSGVGAALPVHDALQDVEWLAVAELDGAPPEYRIARAAPIDLADILENFGEQVVSEQVVEWHVPSRSVRARRKRMLGALVLEDIVATDADPMLVQRELLDAIAREGVDTLPWNASAIQLRERLAFVRMHDDRWPDVSAATLATTLTHWLAPHVSGMRKWSELVRVDWTEALLSQLPWEQRAVLDRLAPTHMEVPSGSRIAIDYSDSTAPVLAVKLQEVFGWTSTPLLLDGRVPLTLHLLSPAQRPVQVTRDLAGFWRTSYFDVRKELRGRYPRHPWPDDPLNATPTRRAKPRGS